MDLQTFEIIAGIMFSLVVGLGVGLFAALNESLQDQIVETRLGVGRLAYMLGLEIDQYHDGTLSFWPINEGSLPASRKDVERFFAENEERLNAVYRHLGLKVEKKTTPMVPAKSEVVVSKIK